MPSPNSYPGQRAMVAEAWVNPLDRLARYVRPDEFHQAFNFSFLQTAWSARDFRDCIVESFRTNDSVGAPAIPDGVDVLIASDLGVSETLPPDHAIWLAVR